MSSNIGPEANAAYQKYLDAKSLEERISKLEEFISLVPKHKATEKIVALNKSRLAKLKRELEAQKQRLKKSTGKRTSPFSIKKEGIQVIFISDFHTPGVGKTSLLNYLTGAAGDKIGKFTPIPEIGIYRYQKIRFQIVDMPSIMEGASKGVGNGKEILSQIRACDLLCLLVDLSRDMNSQVNLLLNELSYAEVRINIPPPPITIEKIGSGKIQVFFLTNDAKDYEDISDIKEKIQEIVKENGVRNAIVKLFGKISLDQVVDALSPSIIYKKAIIIATKGDLPHTEEKFNDLKKNYSELFPLIIGSSTMKQIFIEDFGEIILNFLHKIRIYTMNAGIVAEKPLIIERDSTVKDVAEKIHKSFLHLFDHALIIREGERQSRKKVGLEYELKDRDIIELHTK
jgi:ribosome-interacting GTPase 1